MFLRGGERRDSQSIGQRIRQGRAAAGLTQEALAGKCGVSRAAVAQWEGDIT
ncbi:MAG: helix-turn-helix transcriptional regulator, partial [Proteobacteria bacterium]|nr:helix-turn-helix transcriptional regulator [Pseudomonadota bacterium]